MIRGANSPRSPAERRKAGISSQNSKTSTTTPRRYPTPKRNPSAQLCCRPRVLHQRKPRAGRGDFRSFRGGLAPDEPSLRALYNTPGEVGRFWSAAEPPPLFWTFPTPTAPLPAKPKRERGPRALRKSPGCGGGGGERGGGRGGGGGMRRGVPGDAARRGDCPFGSPVRSRQALVRRRPPETVSGHRPSPRVEGARHARVGALRSNFARSAERPRGFGFCRGRARPSGAIAEPSRSHRRSGRSFWGERRVLWKNWRLSSSARPVRSANSGDAGPCS